MEIISFDKLIKGNVYYIDYIGFKFRHRAKFENYREKFNEFNEFNPLVSTP